MKRVVFPAFLTLVFLAIASLGYHYEGWTFPAAIYVLLAAGALMMTILAWRDR